MKRGASIGLGLVLIVAGAVGLSVVNVHLLPQVLGGGGGPQPAVPQPSTSTSRVDNAASPTGPLATASESSVPTAAVPASDAGAPSDTGVAAGLGPFRFEPSMTTSKKLVMELGPLVAYLKKNPNARVTLIGHGDEGQKARDYLDLGRGRALAVRRALLDYQVPVARVAFEAPPVEGAEVAASAKMPGAVQVKIISSEKGESHVP